MECVITFSFTVITLRSHIAAPQHHLLLTQLNVGSIGASRIFYHCLAAPHDTARRIKSVTWPAVQCPTVVQGRRYLVAKRGCVVI